MGAYDTTTTVIDNVTDNLSQYHNELQTAILHLMSSVPYAAYGTPASMTGNVTLTDSDFPLQSYSPTAARDLTLPAVATTNHPFYVINRSATYDITIKNDGGTAVTTLSASTSVLVVSDGANDWYAIGGGGGGAWGSITGTLSDQTDLLSGWIDVPFTCNYSSADAPIFVISVAGDVTGYIGVGDRIKLTQSTGGTKYFIVHAVGNYSGGATLLTVYGGTDFTLNNEAILNPYFSHARTPIGFPKNPNKWSVVVTDNVERSAASTANTYLQVNAALKIDVPIGNWSTRGTKAVIQTVSTTAINILQIFAALSTSNNSVSDNDLLWQVQYSYLTGNYINGVAGIYAPLATIVATSKTTYYLVQMCNASGTSNVRGDNTPTVLRLVDNYL